ncbi:MAG: LptF/LptG family permease [Phycisphaerae bacterium]|nr:LptF/LptG family permease [Phycisphaerae bacterium]
MKILDRYIAKNFLIGYAIAFCVLIGLRVVIDLFIGLDEFVENLDTEGVVNVLKYVGIYYAMQLSLYFKDFASMITVVAAAFSLGRFIRNNELIAIMASGISLKRVAVPILFLSIFFAGLLVIDQEVIIPRISHRLVQSKDDIPGQEQYDVWMIPDGNGSLFYSSAFDVNSASLKSPCIITREQISPRLWKVTGRISADKAVYNYDTMQWDLINGRLVLPNNMEGFQPLPSYKSPNLEPINIPVMAKAEHTSMLSFKQLNALTMQNPRDVAQLYSQKNFRITEPIINFITLMVSLPVLICRDPRSMKSAVLVSFSITSACLLMTFGCKMLSTEELFFSRLIPEFWAWLPVFIFLPIAFIELDAMKT